MKNILLSIIIPAFNVEDFVEECITSIKNQLVNFDYEVIIINDGSTDETLKLAKQLTRNLPNFKVISQENKGLSGTRNKGVKEAKGDYIWFIDSDDLISDNSLQIIGDILQTKKIDCVAIGFERIGDNKNINQESYLPLESKFVNGRDFFSHQIAEGDIYTMSQLYIIKKKILINNELYFEENIYHEDMLHTPLMLNKVDEIYSIPYPFYLYRVREGSIMTSKDCSALSKKANDLLHVFDKIRLLLSINDQCFRRSLSQYCHHIYRTAQQSAKAAGDSNLSEDLERRYYSERIYLLSPSLPKKIIKSFFGTCYLIIKKK